AEEDRGSQRHPGPPQPGVAGAVPAGHQDGPRRVGALARALKLGQPRTDLVVGNAPGLRDVLDLPADAGGAGDVSGVLGAAPRSPLGAREAVALQPADQPLDPLVSRLGCHAAPPAINSFSACAACWGTTPLPSTRSAGLRGSRSVTWPGG